MLDTDGSVASPFFKLLLSRAPPPQIFSVLSKATRTHAVLAGLGVEVTKVAKSCGYYYLWGGEKAASIGDSTFIPLGEKFFISNPKSKAFLSMLPVLMKQKWYKFIQIFFSLTQIFQVPTSPQVTMIALLLFPPTKAVDSSCWIGYT